MNKFKFSTHLENHLSGDTGGDVSVLVELGDGLHQLVDRGDVVVDAVLEHLRLLRVLLLPGGEGRLPLVVPSGKTKGLAQNGSTAFNHITTEICGNTEKQPGGKAHLRMLR